MLRFRKKRFGIAFEYRWFADRPSPASAVRAVHYMQCARPGYPLLGFRNRKIYVRIVDLLQDEEAILADMKPRTRTDIRKAGREGISVQVCEDKQAFLEFYNGFADAKRGHVSRLDDQVHWGENTLVLTAVREDTVLVMNHYIVCRATGRARMMYSASQFRGVNSSGDRNRIARANRFLHFEAMLYFKHRGLSVYDFGEFAVGTDDESLQGVNRFKESFGGRNEECYKSQTLAMFLLSKMIHVARSTAIHRHVDRVQGSLGYGRHETKSLN